MQLKNDFAEFVEEAILEHDLIEESTHKGLEHVFLWVRNASVFAAFVIFIVSLIFHEHGHLLKGIAYFLGAGAYVSEILMLTDAFSKKIPHKEMFMAYLFGPLYIILGISYLIGV